MNFTSIIDRESSKAVPSGSNPIQDKRPRVQVQQEGLLPPKVNKFGLYDLLTANDVS